MMSRVEGKQHTFGLEEGASESLLLAGFLSAPLNLSLCLFFEE